MPENSPAPAALPLGTFSFVLALVALAGYVDAVGYLRFAGLFVSFMSGNTTSLGVAIASGAVGLVGELAGVIGLFVAGVVGGNLLHRWAGRWGNKLLLFVITALLLLAYAGSAIAIAAPVLAMGVLNASVYQVGRVKVSLTFVTGTLVRFGMGLGRLAQRPSPGPRLAVAYGTVARVFGWGAGRSGSPAAAGARCAAAGGRSQLGLSRGRPLGARDSLG
jgi:uncharacterized membrane protein YoaK (UPF0700 family)